VAVIFFWSLLIKRDTHTLADENIDPVMPMEADDEDPAFPEAPVCEGPVPEPDMEVFPGMTMSVPEVWALTMTIV